MTSAPPVLAANLNAGLKRLKMAAMRRLAPELLLTAETQRWSLRGVPPHPGPGRNRRPRHLEHRPLNTFNIDNERI